MVKVLKAAGVICGIVAFVIFLLAGLGYYESKGLTPDMGLRNALEMFFVGFAFFSASLLIVTSLQQPGSASTAGKEIKKPAQKQVKTKPAQKTKSAPKGDIVSIYVGNLSPEANESVLRTAFSGFGEIARIKIAKQRGGRPKGFAFVDIHGQKAADAAIESLDGKELAGRTLKVNLAKRKEKTPEPLFD